jgi:stalled ribosome alternative rescue factor ArfA
MKKITFFVVFLVLFYFVNARITVTMVQKNRQEFNKMSKEQQQTHLTQLVDKYMKKFPQSDIKKVKEFLGAQFQSNVQPNHICHFHDELFQKKLQKQRKGKFHYHHGVHHYQEKRQHHGGKHHHRRGHHHGHHRGPHRHHHHEKFHHHGHQQQHTQEARIQEPIVTQITSNIVKKVYKNYEIYFNKERAHAINSTQFGWVKNPGGRPGWKNDKDSRIMHQDYVNTNFDRGHLSPYNILGEESMEIINAVPQVPCHNR